MPSARKLAHEHTHVRGFDDVWYHVSVFLTGIIVTLVVFVAALSSGILPSSKEKRQARFSNLRLVHVWEAENEEEMVSGTLSSNRTGGLVYWLSDVAGSTRINFGGISSSKFQRFPERSLSFSTAGQHISELAVDDTAIWLAVALEKIDPTVELWRWKEEEEQWHKHTSLHVSTSALRFDETSRLLIASPVPRPSLQAYTLTDEGAWSAVSVHTGTPSRTDTVEFGQALVTEKHFVAIGDPGWSDGVGSVTLYKILPELQHWQTLQAPISSPFHDTLGFGSHLCLSYAARRLFVSYGHAGSAVEVYERTLNGQFQHLQTVQHETPQKSVSFPRFGFGMSCNDQYWAVSAPGEKNDGFSSVFVYSFDGENGHLVMPQQLSMDVSFFGQGLWLKTAEISSSNRARNLFSLTLLVSDENSGDFGRLVMYRR